MEQSTSHVAGRSICARPTRKGYRSRIRSTGYFHLPFQLSCRGRAVRTRCSGYRREGKKRELTEEKDVIVAPERHYDSRRLVQRGRLEVLE